MRPSTVPSPTCVQKTDDSFDVAELCQAGLERHAQGRTGFDRIKTEIVAHVVERRNIIEGSESEVGADKRDRLILDAADNRLAGFVRKKISARDDATGHAARPDLAFARKDQLAELFAAQFRGMLEFPFGKITRRKRSHFVDRADDRRRAVQVLRSLGPELRIVDQFLRESFGSRAEKRLIRHFHSLANRLADDNGLQPLAPHDRAETAARGMIAALVAFAGRGDAGARHQIFAGLADAYNRGIRSKTFLEAIRRRIRSESHNIVRPESVRPIPRQERECRIASAFG